MHVLKRGGHKQSVHFDKITARIETLCYGLNMNYVDPSAITLRVIGDLYSGIKTVELDNLAAETAASMINHHSDYAILAARIAISNLHKETTKTFSEVISNLYNVKKFPSNEPSNIISKKYYNIIQTHADRLNSVIIYDRDFNYTYTAFKMLESDYLLKINGKVAERPQHMLMRVAVAVHGEDIDRAIETYDLLSKQYFTYPALILKTACTIYQQMTSAYLLTMKDDSIDGILDSLSRTALLAFLDIEVGFNVHCIRAKNTPIRGTGGVSNGLVPMLKAYNTSNATVSRSTNTEAKITIYLEPWHADIFEFLELKRNIGEEQLRAKNMFYALWIPDLFMQRIYYDQPWHLMCPHDCPGLIETYGDKFNELYIKYEEQGLGRKKVLARDLWLLITQVQAETGMPYIVFKDHCNFKSNQQNLGTIKCANFSTEIVQYSNSNETSACNTASIAIDMFVNTSKRTFDFYKLKEVVKIITYNLDKMIDVNFYSFPETESSSRRHRSIGIGIQGLADAFILMKYPYESKLAKDLNIQIFETLYYGALEASCEMAAEKGFYESYEDSPISKGTLQYDMWNVQPTDLWNWETLKKKIAKHGVRNSLLIAQMSDASMAQILGRNDSIEPYASNIYTMYTSRPFPVVKPFLVRDLLEVDCWNKIICNKILSNGGSIQNIENIPENLKLLYKTAWEMPQQVIFDMAKDRGPFIDHSQCLNIHMSNPLDKLTSMHFYAWKMGLKASMHHLRTESVIETNKEKSNK